MTRALAVAALLLLAACGSDESDKLPDDLASAEGVERPDTDVEPEAEQEAEPPPAPAAAPTNQAVVTDPLLPGTAEEPPPIPEEGGRPPASLPKPSFDCGGDLSRVETLICNDPQLAHLDRRLARDFDRALGEASPEQRQRLTNLGRRYLADRNRCPTRACVAQAYRWYQRDIATLMSWPGR